MNEKGVQMKELVKKISKAVLVLCLSMVMMIGSGSAWGDSTCKFDPDHIQVCDEEGVCMKRTRSMLGRGVESVEVTVLNIEAYPQTLTLEFENDNVYLDTDPESFKDLQPNKEKTETITYKIDETTTQEMDQITFLEPENTKFEILLGNERCEGS